MFTVKEFLTTEEVVAIMALEKALTNPIEETLEDDCRRQREAWDLYCSPLKQD